MKGKLSHAIRYGLAAGSIVALGTILAACSSSPSAPPATTQAPPATTQAPSATTAAPAAPPTTAAPAAPPSSQPPGTAPNPAMRGGASGTLSTINGNVLTLTTQQGTVTVNIDANTSIEKTVNGTTADLQVGQSLSASGSQDASGNLTATSISILPQGQGFSGRPSGTNPNPNPSGRPRPSSTGSPRSPNGFAGRGAFGTISKIDGNTLTLTNPQGSVTVTLTSSTTIQKITPGTPTDLQTGESLNVMGARDASGNVTANSIIIRPQQG